MQTCRQPACAVTRSRAASIVACSGRYVRGSGRSMFALRCCGKCATTIARGRINQPIDRCRVNAERDELSSATRCAGSGNGRWWRDNRATPAQRRRSSRDGALLRDEGAGGYNIEAEFNDDSDDRGVISMARGPDPDSAGSQFFICLATVHRLDHQYTTFGKLIKGQDVLEKIGDTPVTRNSMGEPSKPTKRVVIESSKIVPADSVK